MKKLLIILTVFSACQKEVKQDNWMGAPYLESAQSKKPFKKVHKKDTLVLQKNCFEELVIKLNKGKGHGKPVKPPKDTIVVDPPDTTLPEPYYGKRVFYINRYGKDVTTSAWTSPYTPVLHCTAPSMAYDSLIKAYIQTAQAYAEFYGDGLIVTDDSAIFNATPVAYRHEQIWTDYNEWYGTHAGGIAYTGSFGTGIESFVFTKLLSGYAKYVLAVAVHEFGHPMGLPHAAKGYYDSFGIWVLESPYIITFDEFCNWMGAAYYSRYGRFEDWAYNRYGVPIYQKNVIRATIAK